jgi:biotin synthase-related radical SAM superfamily protein
MVTIGKKEIPNKSTELSVKQFTKVNEILRSENEPIEKWYQIFTYLGADESDINDLEFDEFKEVVRLFNDSESKDLEIQRTIEIDGYTY